MKSEPACSVGQPHFAVRDENAIGIGNLPDSLSSATQPSRHDIHILDPGDAAEWDRRVFAHPDYTFFHSAAWAKVICETYGHAPHYQIFSEPGGEVLALVPLVEVLSFVTGRRGVCLPFSDFCAPLVFQENQRNLVETEILRLARQNRWKYVEIRGAGSLEITCNPAVTYYGHKLDLTDPVEAVFDRFAGGTKGAVRQALKNGLEVSTFDSEDSVRDFFRLHVTTRRRHGTPPQPWKFFVNLHRNVIKRGLGFVVLARAGAQTVAGAIFCSFGDRAVYKFAASDPNHAKSRANNLVLWHAIKQLVGTGFKILDFGRTSLANDGLRRFKLSWGAKEEQISYVRLDAFSGHWSGCEGDRGSSWYSHVSRRLPIPLNNLLGAIIYPHLD
ncbi:MAG TPA: GNAT family N-acetyltransferase [Chthoniobacterales bacterium]